MKFEHLIQINDPANPLIESLTRDQVWQGLLQRIHNPIPFLPGLESCRILEKTPTTLRRALDFGGATIHDTVTTEEWHWVCFTITRTETHAGGSLTIQIEEPEAGVLFLRFRYETTLGHDGQTEDNRYVEYVKSAYLQSDLDCVRLIRDQAKRSSRH